MAVVLMSVSIIVILCSAVNLQHTDNPKIVFRFQEKYGTDFIVARYQPLDIVLDNFFAQYACYCYCWSWPESSNCWAPLPMNSSACGLLVVRTATNQATQFQYKLTSHCTKSLYDARCLKFNYTGQNDVFIKHITFVGSSDSVMGVPNVTDNMMSRWWCVVLQRHKDGKPYNYHGRNYTAQNIVFRLRSNLESTFNMKLIYIISGIGVTAVSIAFLLILTKLCCCKHAPLQVKIDPDSVFYMNLEIFRQQYERELQAQEEPVYEEID